MSSAAPAPTSREVDARRSERAAGGLLQVSLVCILAATIAAATVGLRSGVGVGIALALQLGLALTTLWAARDAISIRRRELRLASEVGESMEGTDATAAETAADPTAQVDDADFQRREVEEARSMHCLFLWVPAAMIAFLAGFRLWATWRPASTGQDEPAIALVFLVVACVWQGLSKAFSSLSAEQLPEASAASEALRESLWAAIVAAISLLSAPVLPAAPMWATRLILIWTAAAAVEQLIRAVSRWFLPATDGVLFLSPVRLVLREAVLMRANPVAGLFDVVEQRFGLSLRSTWAITFLRRAVRPAAILVALLCWAVSGLAVVDTHQLGLREHWGRLVGAPLPPGLHLSLPWPCGKIRCLPVKSVSTMQVGFRDAAFGGRMSQRKSILWTKPHDEEFSLVLGTGTELVAVNAVVYFKISEDSAQLLDYAYHTQSPESALEAYAYRVLMEETRSRSLAEILSTDRQAFVNRLLESLRDYTRTGRLGIDVIDVALVNLHPPVDAAADYLDTIIAAIDADRDELNARGRVAVEQQDAMRAGAQLINDAKIDADRRLANAATETARFRAARDVYLQEGPAYQTRLVLDTLSDIFRGKRLVLLDRALAGAAADVLLDLRDLSTPPAAPPAPAPMGGTIP